MGDEVDMRLENTASEARVVAPSARVAATSSARVAATTLRMAVLLEAGAVPERVFSHLAAAASDSEEAEETARIAERIVAGASAVDAIEGEGDAWVWIATAWRIATAVGAPLSPALRSIAAVAVDAQAAADDVRITLAEPAATARFMLWMPLVAVAMGVALGFDSLGILFTNPIGIGCLIAGCALIFTARTWTKRIVAKALGRPTAPGLREELTAIALAGGASPARARQLIDDCDLPELHDDSHTEGVLRLSTLAGVPAVDLLRAGAAAALQQQRTSARLTAAKLSTRLLLPLGVCTLPAFLLLGVAPMLLSVIATTSVSL